MKLSYYDTPFPHICGELSEELYESIQSEWELYKDKEKKYSVPAGNRCNIEITNENIKSKLFNICLNVHQRFSDNYLEHYPKLLDENIELTGRFLFSENSATDEPYKIRGWHLDSGDKFLVGLWYFKDPEDNSLGGDLLLMNPKTKEVKKFEYGTNQFIIFPNLPISWHAVTPRQASKYPRRYVNLLLESKDLVLHNYRRSGKTVDDEFRGKLVNYYK